MAQLPRRIDKNNVKEFLAGFDNILSDCDGVLWKAGKVIGHANDTVAKLESMGKKMLYVTNTSTISRDQMVEKCHKLGYQAKKEDMLCATYVVAQYLHQLNFNRKVYIVGESGIGDELDNVKIRHTGIGADLLPDGETFWTQADKCELDADVGAVAIGMDGHISMSKLIKASSYLLRSDCLFLALNPDQAVPTNRKDIILPGAGAVVSAIEAASGRKATVTGKPSKELFNVIKQSHNLDPTRTLMVGDRCNTDILFGKNCGLQTLVVLSGSTSYQDLEKYAESDNIEDHKLLADYYIPELGDLLNMINE